MKTLDLTKKENLFDYLLRYLATKAKSMTMEEWICYFVEYLIFRNNTIVPDIQKALKCSDMTKMYWKLKEAVL